MRIFEDENYYQILQVPTDAGKEEIKRAYREALALYEEESVVTYSLFSHDQRENLLREIETAFRTLVNDGRRAAYNQMLIDTGQVDPSSFSRQAQRMLAAGSDSDSMSKEKNLRRWIEKKNKDPEIQQLIEAIQAAPISGPQLKQLREAFGVEIAEIYAITKISGDILNRIEADQFDDLPAKIYLKQFLQTYAEILHLDPLHVVENYLKAMDQDHVKSQK